MLSDKAFSQGYSTRLFLGYSTRLFNKAIQQGYSTRLWRLCSKAIYKSTTIPGKLLHFSPCLDMMLPHQEDYFDRIFWVSLGESSHLCYDSCLSKDRCVSMNSRKPISVWDYLIGCRPSNVILFHYLLWLWPLMQFFETHSFVECETSHAMLFQILFWRHAC